MIDATTQRAQVLCREIKAAYAHFRSDPPRKCCIGPDLTALVTKYIPVGSSFDEAESILRNMRVAVGRNSPVFPGEDVGVARLGSSFPCEHDIVVNLTPRAPGDHSAIAQVHAEIAILCL